MDNKKERWTETSEHKHYLHINTKLFGEWRNEQEPNHELYFV